MRGHVLVAILLAGCATAPDAPGGGGPVIVDGPEAGWRILPTGFVGGEPSVGVAASGAIFMSGAVPMSEADVVAQGSVGGQLIRSLDGGMTWEHVPDPGGPKYSMDPWMWLDPATDRVFNAPLNAHCSHLSWSDDEGATWIANPAVACVPPSHDHQKLVTGPAPPGVRTVSYPGIVYYAYNSLLVTGTTGIFGVPVPADERLGTIVSTSLDGGLTFGPGQIVHASGCHRGIVGPPAVAPDGTVYVPHGTCDGVDVMVSKDGGATWETASIEAVGSLEDFAFDPAVAVDADGTTYLAWQARDALLHLSTSEDAGATWSEPRPIAAEGLTVTVWSSMVAGAPGTFALAYAGTAADPTGWEQRASSFAPEDTVWHLYVAVYERGELTTHRLTTDEDPLQVGCIWMRGGASSCRNLLDFVTIVQRDGRLYLAYTDGCDACASASESQRSDLVLAISPDAPLA